MSDLFKKFLYTGVGLVTSTTEKVQTLVNDLVSKGKLSQEEGEKVVSDLMEDTTAKRNEFEEKLRAIVEETLAKFNLPSNQEMKALYQRIEELEAKLKKEGKSTKTTAKKVIKKATTRRRTSVKKTADAIKDAVK